ncbi:DUF6461 domain-containing protein [Streptomyces sp. NPDC056144]|uniref:DUF6461 domain-containing protein n=1 Tax=unclassified Streptomyces TaxID=2593676 RepID=UPI0035E37CC6
MTDGITWLAAPQSIAYGGYGVVLARGLTPDELVARLARATYDDRTPRPLGDLTSVELIEELDDEYGGDVDDPALRVGQDGDWVYAVMYGLWQGEFEDLTPVSRDGAHVFHLEFEETNGKPVPPFFHYFHDDRHQCGFNLHLDGSWGSAGVDGDPEVASKVQDLLTAAGLPSEVIPQREVHRATLQILEAHFGLDLPRVRVLDDALPSVVLETD